MMVSDEKHPVRAFGKELWGDRFPLYLPSLVAIGFGLILMLPADTFSQGPAYRAMADVASEVAWGLVLFSIGAVHVTALYRRSRRCWLARAVVQTLWAFLAGAFAISTGGIVPGIAVCGGYAILAFWGRTRVGRS